MFTPRVYFANLFLGSDDSSSLELPDEASHYLQSVLRLVADDPIELFDGRGGYATAQLTLGADKPRGKAKTTIKASVRLLAPVQVQAPPTRTLHLLQGLALGDKMDWIIEKAVELGVTRITPVQTELSTLRLDEDRAEKRLTHWNKIAIAACAQSGQRWLPLIDPVSSFAQALELAPTLSDPQSALIWFASPQENRLLGSYLPEISGTGYLACFIGPESGFSAKELLSFARHRLAPLSFGKLVLRTETAGLAWLAGISALNGVK